MRFDIIGGGLIGGLLALVLKKEGYDVTIYERFDDIRKLVGGGRSINLVLTSRGLRAVAMLGDDLFKSIMALCVPVEGRIVHQVDGEVNFQPYGKDKSDVNWSISRLELNKLLIQKAEEAGVELNFNHQLLNVNPSNNTVDFKVNGVSKTVLFDTLVAADGGGSNVRQCLAKQGFLKFTSDVLDSGYKELLFPLTKQGDAPLARKGLHIWPRGDHFLMGLCNLDGSFTGTIYIKNKGKESFEDLNTRPKILDFFNKYYSDTIHLLGGQDAVVTQMLNNPAGFLGTVRTNKYYHQNKILIIGDAAHAIVPFFGQGTNCGFEDCYVLQKLLQRAKQSNDYEAAFAAFDADRRLNANAIADMAMDNYEEMQSKTASKEFLLMKEVQNTLEKKYPTKFRSRYSMVCYGGAGNVSYSVAQRLGAISWDILRTVCAGASDISQVNFNTAIKLIDRDLVPVQNSWNVDLSSVSKDLTVSRPIARL